MTSAATTTYTTQEGTHKTDDGANLYAKTWKVNEDNNIKARVLFVHGFSDHCNNYPVLFDYFAGHGVEVYAFDQRGWGRSVQSKSQRGLTGPTPRVLADITSVLSTILPSATPTFLMGHSMGGAEILHYAAASAPSSLLSQLRGFISSAPLIALHPDTRPFRITVLAGRLAGKLLPKRQLVNQLDSQWLSRDPAQNALWEKDELCHDTGTLEGLAGMLDRGLLLETGKTMVSEGVGEGGKTRLLVLHGTGDHVNDYVGTKAWVERCKVEDLELKTFEGWYHNMHAEPGNDKLMFATHVTDWILKRSGPLEQGQQEDASKAKL